MELFSATMFLMSAQKIKVTILFGLLLFFIVLDIGLVWVYQKKRAKQRATPISIPSTSPKASQKEPQKGIIKVWFGEEVNYEKAEDLLVSLSLQIKSVDSFVMPVKSQDSDPISIKKFNIFEVKTPIGKEEEIISRLTNSPMVERISKVFE